MTPSGPCRLDRLRFESSYGAALALPGPGGDWFDVFTAGGSVALVIGDVVGHGAGAVAAMTEIRCGLRSHLLDHRDPAAALAHTNRLAFGIGGFATALCVLFDPDDGTLRWARAGHLPPLVGSPEAVAARMPLGGPMMGALPDARFPVTRARLGEGEMIVLYTDGLVERRGETIGEGIARLEGTVRKLAASATLDCGAVVEAVADEAQDDDSCLVLAWHDA
jgi:serine phosphatase RsbU (regulator of sigma subunit)